MPSGSSDVAGIVLNHPNASTTPSLVHLPESIVYMPDSKAIKGGTLDALVEHLLENTASKFAKCFLLTYESFTTPAQLLALLQVSVETSVND